MRDVFEAGMTLLGDWVGTFCGERVLRYGDYVGLRSEALEL